VGARDLRPLWSPPVFLNLVHVLVFFWFMFVSCFYFFYSYFVYLHFFLFLCIYLFCFYFYFLILVFLLYIFLFGCKFEVCIARRPPRRLLRAASRSSGRVSTLAALPCPALPYLSPQIDRHHCCFNSIRMIACNK